MFSEPSQVPTSLISPPASPRGLPLTIVDAEGAPARSPAFDLSQVAGYLGDFVLDESFNADFLFQSQHSNNKNNTNQHAIATAAATSNEPQMNLEPLGFQFDPAFLDGLDMEMLISEAEAIIQSPGLAALMPSDQVQLEADAELESLLDSIVAQDDSAAVNSPSAEITYPHLAMTPSFVQEETWSSSDILRSASGLATAAFLASVQTDETTSSSFATTYEDDDDSQSTKEPSRGRGRVRSGPGSVSKPYKSKKESNKAAAERYRNKKQNEKKELFAECERHEQRNRELKAEIDEVQAELNFIKNLLVEALLTKQTAAKS